MINIIIIAVIVVLGFFGVRSVIKRFKGDCGCGGSGPCEIAVKPHDLNKKNYTSKAVVKIDGMKCKNCSSRIQNKLNEADGIWAKVNLGKKNAELLLKDNITEDQVKKIITDAGYTVADISVNKI